MESYQGRNLPFQVETNLQTSFQMSAMQRLFKWKSLDPYFDDDENDHAIEITNEENLLNNRNRIAYESVQCIIGYAVFHMILYDGKVFLSAPYCD